LRAAAKAVINVSAAMEAQGQAPHQNSSTAVAATSVTKPLANLAGGSLML